MPDAAKHVTDLIFGRWRSQTLHAGVELGVFDLLSDHPKHAVEIADQLDLDRDRGYRLLRALSSLGLLEESSDRRFSLTAAGELLQADHPMSLRGVARLEEGPTHYAVWKHLPDVVREGEPDGFQREFGHAIFEHAGADPDYAERFNEAMTGLSRIESAWVTELLADVAFDQFDHVCDVGGGHGHLLCSLLQGTDRTEGTVLELPGVVEDDEHHRHEPMDVADRVNFVAGDFFEGVPEANAYLLKHILHDWSDAECVDILSSIREAAPDGARVFNCEHVVPGPDEAHLGKLFDVHMMVVSTGRERTEAEYAELYEQAGFELTQTHETDEIPMGVVEGRAI
jgi:DNA-binding MarR family transcriptional regulator